MENGIRIREGDHRYLVAMAKFGGRIIGWADGLSVRNAAVMLTNGNYVNSWLKQVYGRAGRVCAAGCHPLPENDLTYADRWKGERIVNEVAIKKPYALITNRHAPQKRFEYALWVLKMIGKGTTVKTITQAVSWAQEAGIIVRGFFILGMPEENDEDIKLTQALADQLELDEYGFTILCPYPGTQMYDPNKFADIPWEETDEYSNDFWHTNYLSNQELKEWQKRLTDRYEEKLTWHNRVLIESRQTQSI